MYAFTSESNFPLDWGLLPPCTTSSINVSLRPRFVLCILSGASWTSCTRRTFTCGRDPDQRMVCTARFAKHLSMYMCILQHVAHHHREKGCLNDASLGRANNRAQSCVLPVGARKVEGRWSTCSAAAYSSSLPCRRLRCHLRFDFHDFCCHDSRGRMPRRAASFAGGFANPLPSKLVMSPLITSAMDW